MKLAKWSEAKDYLNRVASLFPNSFEGAIAKQLLEEPQYFSVQVGAFKDRSGAEALATELKQKNEYAYTIETVDSQNTKFYRVRVGHLTLLDDAQKLKSELSTKGYPTTQIFP